uniref:hypothetical protein n=1 Tax=Candidatus Wujingus californicus TaxID=3367618 RepID=UPI004028935C
MEFEFLMAGSDLSQSCSLCEGCPEFAKGRAHPSKKWLRFFGVVELVQNKSAAPVFI